MISQFYPTPFPSLKITNVFSTSADLLLLGVSPKWNYIMCLASFAEQHFFQDSAELQCISITGFSYGKISSLWIFIHRRWPFRLFLLWGILTGAVMSGSVSFCLHNGLEV